MTKAERIERKIMTKKNCEVKVEPSPEWYREELNSLYIQNEKLKKLVDILLEREMYENN